MEDEITARGGKPDFFYPRRFLAPLPPPPPPPAASPPRERPLCALTVAKDNERGPLLQKKLWEEEGVPTVLTTDESALLDPGVAAEWKLRYALAARGDFPDRLWVTLTGAALRVYPGVRGNHRLPPVGWKKPVVNVQLLNDDVLALLRACEKGFAMEEAASAALAAAAAAAANCGGGPPRPPKLSPEDFIARRAAFSILAKDEAAVRAHGPPHLADGAKARCLHCSAVTTHSPNWCFYNQAGPVGGPLGALPKAQVTAEKVLCVDAWGGEGLPYNLSLSDLRQAFNAVAPVKAVSFTPPQHRRTRAFVEFTTAEGAEKALALARSKRGAGISIRGLRLRVERARRDALPPPSEHERERLEERPPCRERGDHCEERSRERSGVGGGGGGGGGGSSVGWDGGGDRDRSDRDRGGDRGDRGGDRSGEGRGGWPVGGGESSPQRDGGAQLGAGRKRLREDDGVLAPPPPPHLPSPPPPRPAAPAAAPNDDVETEPETEEDEVALVARPAAAQPAAVPPTQTASSTSTTAAAVAEKSPQTRNSRKQEKPRKRGSRSPQSAAVAASVVGGAAGGDGGGGGGGGGHWACPVCTLLNPWGAQTCSACGGGLLLVSRGKMSYAAKYLRASKVEKGAKMLHVEWLDSPWKGEQAWVLENSVSFQTTAERKLLCGRV
jgi:hypothetical protein